MPTDIPTLEIDFAKNASLNTCLPLCEAYLAVGRFMEAMVVCKKGIKLAPAGDPRGRLMLARVYVEQGKLPKAEHELQSILTQHPGHLVALTLLGRTYVEQGRKADATPIVQQVLRQDPTSAEVRALVAQLGPVGGAPLAPAYAPPPAPDLTPLQPKPTAVPPPAPTEAHTSASQSAPLAPAPPAAKPAAGAVSPTSAGPDDGPTAALPSGALSVPAPPPPDSIDATFAADNLGFTAPPSDELETAGTSRLTLLGFVTGGSGSWKVTLASMFTIIVLASAYLTWMHHAAQNKKEKAVLFAQVRAALDVDRYAAYQKVQALGEQILRIDGKHTLTLSAMAYANAVLVVDHHDAEALQKAQTLLADAQRSGNQENEFRVAAAALVQFAHKDVVTGLAAVRQVIDRGATHPLVLLEACRLLQATGAAADEQQKFLRMLATAAGSQVRAHVYVGMAALGEGDGQRAARAFDSALQLSKDHPVAGLGRHLATLQEPSQVAASYHRIHDETQVVLRAPSGTHSPPVLGLARFVESQLLLWEGRTAPASQQFAAAQQLDPDNPLFYSCRAALLLALGNPGAAVPLLSALHSAQPTHNPTLYSLLTALTRSGAYHEARSLLTQARSDSPKDAHLALAEGQLLAAREELEEAQRVLGAIRQQDGNALYVEAQLALSALWRSHHQAARAQSLMETLLGHLPEVSPAEVARVWGEMGDVYAQAGHPDKATAAYSDGAQQNPLDGHCQQQLCKLLGTHTDEGRQACGTARALQSHSPAAP